MVGAGDGLSLETSPAGAGQPSHGVERKDPEHPQEAFPSDHLMVLSPLQSGREGSVGRAEGEGGREE